LSAISRNVETSKAVVHATSVRASLLSIFTCQTRSSAANPARDARAGL